MRIISIKRSDLHLTAGREWCNAISYAILVYLRVEGLPGGGRGGDLWCRYALYGGIMDV